MMNFDFFSILLLNCSIEQCLMVKDDEDDDDFSLSIACQIDLVHYEYFAMANKQIYEEKKFPYPIH